MKKILVTMLTATAMLVATAQENTGAAKQKTINVTGVADMEIIPDEIYVQVTLQEYDKKGAGKISIEAIKNNFLAACKSIGLTENEISVQSYSGYDNNYWWYKKRKKENPDMKANITYSIKLASTKKMDELVEKLDDEATQSFNISKVSHSKMDELKKQLKIQAIKAAKEKATYLAAAIDEQVGGAIAINDANEINQDYPRPMLYDNVRMKMEAADAGAPMNVDFKKIKLQFEVNVVFALK
ncbi:SIMPL domain-containing protein [Foetidibacter luteolus]|uniref:SIMPL domain-containing protein n=1 Tax=Foetidibacter luteolus TaxID=2608880 RepID=UPI00129C0753|nr:SIMPL domain-containing protein [Foetidibacter luteolus]